MKIIDAKIKGNAIRLYLGKDNLKDWTGDDWNDRGCEDTVYDEYVEKVVDKTYDFKDSVFSIFNLMNDEVSKDMLKSRAYPLLIICKGIDKEGNEDSWKVYDYRTAMEWENKEVIYMGDSWKGE